MKDLTRTALLLAVLGFSASLARAQEAATSSAAPAVEVTPFVSIDSRGSTPIGGAFSFPLGGKFSLETEVGFRRGEGDMNALSTSANLLYALPRLGRATPYLATGAGLAQSGLPITSRDGSVVGTQARVAFEINAGGGLKVPVDENWGMRTDARWFKSFGRNGSEHWRVAQGVSFDVKR